MGGTSPRHRRQGAGLHEGTELGAAQAGDPARGGEAQGGAGRYCRAGLLLRGGESEFPKVSDKRINLRQKRAAEGAAKGNIVHKNINAAQWASVNTSTGASIRDEPYPRQRNHTNATTSLAFA